MKKYVVVSLLCLILVLAVGCAKSTPTDTAPETSEPVMEDVVEETVADSDVSGESVDSEVEDSETAETGKPDADVRILGKEGFDPVEVTIRAGDSVSFVNENTKDDALIFQSKET